MENKFCEGLKENNVTKLLEVSKSDIHNHSSKGCRRVWLEERLKRNLPKPPDRNVFSIIKFDDKTVTTLY